MDEADVLGDRIAIISNGKLISHGTSYFLKNRFGRGYYLTFAKKQQDDAASSTNISSNESNFTDDTTAKLITENHINKSSNLMLSADDALNSLKTQTDLNIHEFVKQRFSNASLVENIGTEMTYAISNKKEFTKDYEDYFSQIEANMDRLGIDSMGISDTTLEEIFIRLAHEPMSNQFQKRNYKLCGFNLSSLLDRFKSSKTGNKSLKLSEEQLKLYSTYTKMRVSSHAWIIFVQLYALLIKRFQRVRRNIKGFFAEIVLPVVFVCVALLVATLTPKPGERHELELHPWYYSEPNKVFISRSSDINFDLNGPVKQTNIDLVNKITDTFYHGGGLGTRCMKGNRVKITKQAELYSRIALGEQIFSCESYDYLNITETQKPSSDFLSQLKLTNYSYSKISPDCDCSSGKLI